MKLVDSNLLNGLTEKAAASPRKRAHHNMHPDNEEMVQRLCIAMEPGSYFRPHRHSEPWKWEMFIVLEGSATIIFFDDSGRITEKVSMSKEGRVKVVEIPSGVWHSLTVQEPGTILLEVKPGTYSPLAPHDFAQWAPAENTAEAVRFEARLQAAETGSIMSEIKL